MNLCYSCHDGGVTPVGQTTVFDVTKEQHVTVGTSCSSDDACHDVHTQNPNGTGRFLVVTRTDNNYCTSCHGAVPFNGNTLGDHTAGSEHYTNTTTFTCNQCHSVHGAPIQTNPIPGLTNPILLSQMRTATYYGAFCISCHSGTPPTPAIPGTGNVASSDPYDYSMAINDGTETKHPTISTTGTFPVPGCNVCHEVHNPTGTAVNYILNADNANSAYCTSCHTGGSAPGVGANTHPTAIPTNINMNQGLTPPLPWAQQIDEDGVTGQDWSGATANRMVCETCHSVHRSGFAGVGAEWLLRRADGSGNQICRDCHTAN